jgi:2-polyprenyl-3-methyl-5-hydroxy-6-metoxy-1,4-benzoquinol methylase
MHKEIIDTYVSGKGSLLDVGCASGAFLRVMRDAGWDGDGVEPSESQFLRASKLLGDSANIQQCLLQDASLARDYDLVTLWDVLEHVTEPAEFSPAGYLALEKRWISRLERPAIR